MKKELNFLIFNKNNDAKWDDKLDLDKVILSLNSCMLGLCKLSKIKSNTRKLISMLKKDIVYNKEKVTIYIDYRLLDRLVHYNEYPFIFRQEGLNSSNIRYIFKLLNKRRRKKQSMLKTTNNVLRDLSALHKGHGNLNYGNKR